MLVLPVEMVGDRQGVCAIPSHRIASMTPQSPGVTLMELDDDTEITVLLDFGVMLEMMRMAGNQIIAPTHDQISASLDREIGSIFSAGHTGREK